MAGNLLVTNLGEALDFTISGLAADTTVRVGVLAGVLADDERARFDAPTISLTDGDTTVSVTELPNLSDGTAGAIVGWVFFDITSDGDYTILVPPDEAGDDPDSTGFGGVTFDTFIGDPSADSDNDQLPDNFELAITATDLNPDGNLTDLDGTLIAGGGPGAGTGDFDGDGLSDFEEYELSAIDLTFPGLNPTLADSDADGRDDPDEINGSADIPATNPVVADTDGDGLLDGVETNTDTFVDATDTGSDPTVADTDSDTLSDGFEVANNDLGYNPVVDDFFSDFDFDGSTFMQEADLGTDFLNPDTDNDGFFDGAETNTGTFISYDFATNTGNTGTDPLNDDSDGDGLLDGAETGTGTFVDATSTGTDPNLSDTDGDNFSDGIEVSFPNGDPNDAAIQPDVRVGYDATGPDWLDGFPEFDIDGDGQLGTDGFIFYGFLGTPQSNGQPYRDPVDNTFTGIESSPLPSYLASHGPGTNFTSIAWGFNTYGLIDDPVFLDGFEVLGGIAVGFSVTGGVSLEIVEFEISNLAPEQVVRVGILGGVEGRDDGRFDPTVISLAGPNGFFEESLDLPLDPGGDEFDAVNAGWLFFDITEEGTYTVSGTTRLDLTNVAGSGGASIGGFTFDSIGGFTSFAIRSIEFDEDTNMITLTWDSQPGATYSIESSADLATFGDTVASDIASEGDITSFTFANPAVDGASRLFFRVIEFLEPEE